MAERKIGLIPRAMTLSRSGQAEECDILVTDRRSILCFDVPLRSAREELRAAFSKSGGEVPVGPEQVDYEKVDLDKLVLMNDNVVVPHAAIHRFSLGKGLGGYGLWVAYINEAGKKLYLAVDLMPPKELLQKRRSEGIDAKSVRKEYIAKCQEVYRKALPPSVAEKGDWRL